MSTVNVKGLDELAKMLDSLPVKIARNIMRAAVNAGSKVVRDKARELVPVDSGDLRKSIVTRQSKAANGTISGGVKTDLFYARFVEFGTRAHIITINAEKRPMRLTRRGFREYSIRTINNMVRRGSLVIGGVFVGDSVSHPGASPKPFMRPAIDASAQDALVAVGEKIKQRLTKQGIEQADDVELVAL